MAISVKSPALMTNPSINPTFTEDTFVILDEDYTQLDPVCSRYLTKNAIGRIVQCGYSQYTYDPETGDYTNLVNEDEWCWLELATPVADFENSEGFVKAKNLLDLLTLSDEELVNRGLR